MIEQLEAMNPNSQKFIRVNVDSLTKSQLVALTRVLKSDGHLLIETPEYAKYKANLLRQQQYSKQYYETHKEQSHANSKKYYETHKEIVKAKCRARYHANKGKKNG